MLLIRGTRLKEAFVVSMSHICRCLHGHRVNALADSRTGSSPNLLTPDHNLSRGINHVQETLVLDWTRNKNSVLQTPTPGAFRDGISSVRRAVITCDTGNNHSRQKWSEPSTHVVNWSWTTDIFTFTHKEAAIQTTSSRFQCGLC